MRYKFLIISLLLSLFISFSSAREKEGKSGFYKPNTIGLVDTLFINNIFLPFQNDGSTGEDAQAYFPNPGIPIPSGYNKSFLFQGGIAASGFVNGQLRASWMAKASLIQELQAGKWEMAPDDSRAKFYVVKGTDRKGSLAYENWRDAVALGADFFDADGDGVYEPEDRDRPDLIGDRTSWTVYNDGTDLSIRSDGLQTSAMGMEIHQQAWAFALSNELGNLIFFRYRFINTGGEDINDFIFSIWADPDIGEASDDLIGCDTTLSLGYIYNNGPDDGGTGPYGAEPPAFGVDFFQGPVVESPGDTALLFRGPQLGVDTLFDMRSLPMTSFVFYNNAGETDPFPSPQQNAARARDYQLGGFNGHHVPIDPTVFGTGGEATDRPQYFYPGDPFAGTGWRDILAKDKRFLVNTGPFQLPAWDDQNANEKPDPGEPGVQDIVVAYVIGQGSDAFESVQVLKEVDDVAQRAYFANFFIAPPPPPPSVEIRTFDNRIEFVIDLEADSTLFHDVSDSLDNRQMFEGIKIYQLASPSTNEVENGQLNRKLIASFDLDNKYRDIYQNSGFETKKVYSGNNNIDTTKFFTDGSAIIRYVVEEDAFESGASLVNNIEYYFSITAFSINRGVNDEGVTYLDSLGGSSWGGGSLALLENNLGGSNLYRAMPGRDENRPFLNDTAAYVGPRQFYDGVVLADVVNRDALTGHEYSLSFLNNGNYWRLTDETLGSVLRDTMTFQDTLGGNEWGFPVIDGMSIRVQNTPSNGIREATPVIDESDENNMVWLDGRGTLDGSTSAYNGGIDFIQHTTRNNLSFKLPGDNKENYFPVRISFETSDVAAAQHYRANYNLDQGMKPTYVTAWDMRDEDNPRQLYVAYMNSLAEGTIDFSQQNPDFIIFDADYQEEARYGRASSDSLFKAESYLVVALALADSVLQPNPMDLDVRPWYPNTDLDVFSITSQELSPQLPGNERKEMLEKVKVVPNPYWAYSAYETSYDTPVLKFTHLDREVTIRIFNLAGQLVITLRKNDESSEISWNLRNASNLKVASGIYIAHVEVPGVGSKVLKFAVITREERLDRF